MNADEKSDKVVVPKKQQNNESLLSADVVEERTLPRRNTDQTTAIRDTAPGNRVDWLGWCASSSATKEVCTIVTSTSLLPLWRSYSRVEPSALVAHAGICGGGYRVTGISNATSRQTVINTEYCLSGFTLSSHAFGVNETVTNYCKNAIKKIKLLSYMIIYAIILLLIIIYDNYINCLLC